MLPTTPSFERVALNRVTFGARAADEAYVQAIGWEAWVADQLSPPDGDDPEVAGLIQDATLNIAYPAKETPAGGWDAVNEDRPLTALTKSPLELWEIYLAQNKTLPGKEVNRVAEEVLAATWMRNTHSAYQVREMMTAFWHNHFNVSANEGPQVRVALPTYDQTVIRPHVFGNFRTMLEADAQSVAMLFYLDNAESQAAQPNENYSRELLELHTMGEDAYLGQTPGANLTAADGFTDQDVIEASRALSGWTVGSGFRVGKGKDRKQLPVTGEFLFEPALHNETAATFLGVNLGAYTGMAQGQKVLELAATHEKTAEYVVDAMLTYLFGPAVPQTLQSAAVTTWMDSREAPDQLRQVMETILLSPEIGDVPPAKLRLPYEKTVAFMRGVGATVVPDRKMFNLLTNTKDTLFSWPAPNGHPDTNGYWLNASTTLDSWKALLTILNSKMTDISVTNESLATSSVTALIEDWVERLIGFELAPNTMAELVDFATSNNGILTHVGQKSASANTVESQLRRLVGMIATTAEFAYR